jgi:peptidoglycan hydrolase-like protein with peptidoglycan-binding domain
MARPVPKTVRATSQTQPSPDRYKEIQAALRERGYLQGEPNGAWGEESTNALKKFQQDKNLPPDGKLNSLSLIALGLGPKRVASANSDANPASQPQQTRPQ